MGFSERDKLKALAIVHIFETSKPLGDYSAVAVLNDGAGVSYGINQFTHRSGSLEAVLRRFQTICQRAGTQQMLVGYERKLHDQSKLSIHELSQDTRFKNGLRAAAQRSEMQQAQREIAFEMYLQPASDACEGSNFTLPLSLAVVYDSINHGSFGKIRDRVVISPPGNGPMKAVEFEQAWITRYVQKRDAWLESIPRLAATDYRTDFFLAQIARGNWSLDLPLNVHGYRLTDAIIDGMLANDEEEVILEIPQAAEPRPVVQTDPQLPTESLPTNAASPQAEAQNSGQLSVVGGQLSEGKQIADQIVNVEAEKKVPDNFVPETVAVEAPPPTGFMGKLKAQGAALLATIGGFAGLKEWFGIQLSPETVELLKILLPTVLGLGFIGVLVWFVAEKVVGFKTLKLQSEIATDPTKHNLKINSQ